MSLLSILIAGAMNVANIQTARTDNWTFAQNPASLVQSSPFQVAAQYENQYLLASLNTATIQFACCNPYVNVGVGYTFFGYSKYQEMQVGITLARRFGRFSLGIQGNYMTIYCGDELKYRGTFIPELGVAVDITEHFTLGVWSYNPFIQSLKIDDQEKRQLSAVYSVGTDYCFLPNLRWSTQADYDVHATWRVATGFEWRCIDQLCLKIGCYYHEQIVGCLGLGLRLDHLMIDTNFELNPRLGLICLGRIGYML